jgi:hypothetical protein
MAMMQSRMEPVIFKNAKGRRPRMVNLLAPACLKSSMMPIHSQPVQVARMLMVSSYSMNDEMTSSMCVDAVKSLPARRRDAASARVRGARVCAQQQRQWQQRQQKQYHAAAPYPKMFLN